MTNYNTVFGAAGASASGNVTAETAFGISPLNTVRTVCGPVPISSQGLDGRELLLRAGVLVTGGTTTNYTSSIRLNSTSNTNLTTFTSDTAIATTSAIAVNSVTRLLVINARVSWDVTTARLNGVFIYNLDTVNFTTWAALTAQLTSGVAAASSIQFLITGIFSASNAGNTAILKYFEMDVI